MRGGLRGTAWGSSRSASLQPAEGKWRGKVAGKDAAVLGAAAGKRSARGCSKRSCPRVPVAREGRGGPAAPQPNVQSEAGIKGIR